MSADKESPEFRKLSQITFAVLVGTNRKRVRGAGFFIAKDGRGLEKRQGGWGLKERQGWWGLTPWHVMEEPLLDKGEVYIFYQEKLYKAYVKYTSYPHDTVALFVPEVEVLHHIKISAKEWLRGDSVLAAGYQKQELILGLNPLELTIDPNKPLRKVRLSPQQTVECLVLSPNRDVDNIDQGASGGPVYNKRTGCIIGVLVGTEKQLVKVVRESGLWKRSSNEAPLESTQRQDTDEPPDMIIDVETAIDLSNYGFAVPFNDLFPDWRGFRRLIDSNEEVLWEDEEPTKIDIFTPPIADFPMVPVPPDKPRFEMSVYLVTNRQYEMFLAYNEYWQCDGGCLAAGDVDANYLAHWRNGRCKESQADRQVINISYHAACAYVEWLSKWLDMRLELPNREEWELAASEGNDLKSWRKEIRQGNYNLDGVNCYDTAGELLPVGDMPCNSFGLYDILGSVYEFCAVDKLDAQQNKVLAIGGSYRKPKEELIEPVELDLNECRDDVGFRFVHRIEKS